ncbi:hypothetical protein [Algicella marina]|uniref:Alpha/beta hydrolase n=1 Tax=Algicella marina TaxID=2683284 RepID=A0A6P1SV42_9RHOB|nr:hypothetical protein [Algicella marina]QHQ34318.1 hypothetical protein GO499_03510 [Algicella marina]
MTDGHCSRPFRRRVFFVPGFDPRSIGTYGALLKSEGQKYAGDAFEMGRRRSTGPCLERWPLTLHHDAQVVQTDYEFFVWRDLISNWMDVGLLETFRRLVGSGVLYIRSGTLRRVWQADKKMFACLIYPYWMACVMVALSIGLAWLVAAVFPDGPIGRITGVVAGIMVAIIFLRWLRSVDGAHYVFWLTHYFDFSIRRDLPIHAEIEARRKMLADAIAEARASECYDEILIVGHSAGAMQAIHCIADHGVAIANAGNTPVTVLTVGQNLSLRTLQPAAESERNAVLTVAGQDYFAWIDVSSTKDWISFALLSPVQARDMKHNKPLDKPLITECNFIDLFDRATLRWSGRNMIRAHFLFFHASKNRAAWNWYDIILGPSLVRERDFESAADSIVGRMADR